jgi:ATP-dependent Clp protease ATP-binding subunit ClpA
MSAELSLDDLTPEARTIVEQAAQEAARRATLSVEPIHLLFALLASSNTLLRQELSKFGIDPQTLQATVAAQLPIGDPMKAKPPEFSTAAQRVVRSAFKEAVHLSHRRVDVIHLLLGQLYAEGDPATTILTNAGVSLYQLRQSILTEPNRFQDRAPDRLSAHFQPSPIFFAIVAVMVACGVGLWRDYAFCLKWLDCFPMSTRIRPRAGRLFGRRSIGS